MHKPAILAALTACVVVAAAAALGLPGHGTAQARAAASYPYRLVDPGTFGGPQSFRNLPAVPLTRQGGLLGTADTATPDADYPNFNPFMLGFPDPYQVHAFEWRADRLTNLGALPGNNSSAVFEVNGNGIGVGMSETATTDPYTGWPSDNAVMFKNGRVINLGTLPGGYESQANDINDLGQVSGFASNGISDPYSLLGWGTQARSFIWHNGVMRDIGTLGGPDAVSTTLNAVGQITGASYTSTAANPATGIPTLDPFLWAGGHMRDLGTLGGTIGFANWLNNAGEVAGTSDLAGDQTNHPFLWTGTKMIDLGTLGGANGAAGDDAAINDAGAVTGNADLADGTHHAFLWQNGHMRDLPPVDNAPCSNGNTVSNNGAVVGDITDCHGDALAAVLWSHGHAYDLNTLIAPSALHLAGADYINGRGEIVGYGVLPNGDQRVFLLIRNPSVPLPAVAPAAKALPVVTARTAPALARRCAALPAAAAAKLAVCRREQ